MLTGAWMACALGAEGGVFCAGCAGGGEELDAGGATASSAALFRVAGTATLAATAGDSGAAATPPLVRDDMTRMLMAKLTAITATIDSKRQFSMRIAVLGRCESTSIRVGDDCDALITGIDTSSRSVGNLQTAL